MYANYGPKVIKLEKNCKKSQQVITTCRHTQTRIMETKLSIYFLKPILVHEIGARTELVAICEVAVFLKTFLVHQSLAFGPSYKYVCHLIALLVG